MALDDCELATQHYRRSQAIANDAEDPHHEGSALGGLGRAASALVDHSEAKQWVRKSLALVRVSSDGTPISYIHRQFGLVLACFGLGEVERSRHHLRRALVSAMGADRMLEALEALVGLASLAVKEAELELAPELLGLAALNRLQLDVRLLERLTRHVELVRVLLHAVARCAYTRVVVYWTERFGVR